MMLYGASFALTRLGRHEEAINTALRCVELLGKASHTLGRLAAAHVDEIADALAKRLAQIVPRAATDEQALLAPFTDEGVAKRISTIIDQSLNEPGAQELTAKYRNGERLLRWNNCSYLQPTIVSCSLDHPLAGKEFLFPYAAVVKVAHDQITKLLGPSLVVTAITEDQKLIDQLVASPKVDRLNIGAVPTNHVSWDQPHEGNLFDHLYARRAFQRAAAV